MKSHSSEVGGPFESWQHEPNLLKWIDSDTGYRCVVLRHTEFWTLNGFVRVPHGHRFYRKHYDKADRFIDVHGGLAFSGRMRHGILMTRGHWFGFDTNHYGDFVPGYAFRMAKMGIRIPPIPGQEEYRNASYVIMETESLARQLKRLA